MKTWFASVLLFAAVSSWAQTPPEPPAEPAAAPAQAVVKVEKIITAAGVEDREPTGEAVQFGADVGQVYCWTKLDVAEPPANVKYVWSKDGQMVHEFTLEAKTSGRWWASKKVDAGSWKVELQSEGGESLGNVEFTVSAEPAAAAPAAEPAPAPAPATK
ncbi:MAG: DUF2914 domain-containing protein [Elusimicrobia bacterium]|nr:DUF2914 domain-containing protein [Elusimicrobiota bacterium]